MNYFFAGVIGLLITIAIGYIVDYYTGSDKKPTQLVAKASTTGSGTNIIM